jgi:hypothetical protein
MAIRGVFTFAYIDKLMSSHKIAAIGPSEAVPTAERNTTDFVLSSLL